MFGGKKTAQAIFEEIGKEIEALIEVAFRDRHRQGSFDLEALEIAVRDLSHRCGATVLEYLLQHEDGAGRSARCSCGGTFGEHRRQEKTVRTVLGPIRLERRRQRCLRCGDWRVPEDEVLDVVRTGFSPGLRRMMAKTAAVVPFGRARELLGELAGLEVTDKDVERIAEATGEAIACVEEVRIAGAMRGEERETERAISPKILYVSQDGTGIPVLRRETEGRKGKGPEGQGKTREVKLGAVFTQTSTDAEGHPVRDPGSTTYVGKIETAESSGPRVYSEALRRGLEKASRVVVIGDGAAWIWNLAEEHFPGAIQILDFFHAKENLGKLAKALYPNDAVARTQWFDPLADLLWEGEIPQFLERIQAVEPAREEVVKAVNYFKNNQDRMRYDQYRAQSLFIGSGVVEAGCRSVIGQRLKQSGMHWSVRGANSIIALRCCVESGRFDDYWESRRAA